MKSRHVLLLALCLSPVLVHADARQRFSVTDAVQTRVVVVAFGGRGREIDWSPKHTAAVVVVARGDVRRNGSLFELLTCKSPCFSLNTATTLFTASTGELTDLLKGIRWVDEQTLVFLWDGGDARGSQLYRLDVPTRRLTQLTEHPTPVLDYDVSADGRRIVFTAEAPRDMARIREMAADGFVVKDQGLTPLLAGNLDGWPWQTAARYEFFTRTERDSSPQRVGNDKNTWSRRPSVPVLAPNGRYAITTRTMYAAPLDWGTYYNVLTGSGKSSYASALRAAFEDSMPGHIVMQYVVIDLDRRTVRPLLDTPLIAGFPWINFGVDGFKEATPVWSPDSKLVAIGPTFLPLSFVGEAGRLGEALAVVEVSTGKVEELPVPAKPGLKYRPVRWVGDGEVVVEASDSTKIAFQKSAGSEWIQAPVPGPFNSEQEATFDLLVRQDLNTPPRIVRREITSLRETLLLDLNPQLKERTLARVELFHWKSSDGKPWTGELYHPVNELPEHRYPLVIQTHGDRFDQSRFEPNGPSATMFAAQPLANRGIMVLQLGVPDSIGADGGTPAESAEHAAGYTSAMDALDSAGLIDRSRVGIIGWSYTGWTVLYTLTHSASAKYPFAAAIVGQNIDCGYFQRIMFAESARNAASGDACNGASPIGPGLQAWLKQAPGFNTDRIQTPIRFEVGDGAWDLNTNWEVFQLLRFQHKPTEMFAIPNYRHGVHELQNPAQRLTSQGGTVDWFDFWLNGHEDPDPAKGEQYKRWQELRKLQEAQSWKPPAE